MSVSEVKFDKLVLDEKSGRIRANQPFSSELAETSELVEMTHLTSVKELEHANSQEHTWLIVTSTRKVKQKRHLTGLLELRNCRVIFVNPNLCFNAISRYASDGSIYMYLFYTRNR